MLLFIGNIGDFIMKITKSYLKQVIKESLEEMSGGDPLQTVENFIRGLESDNAFIQWSESAAGKGDYHMRQLQKAKAALQSLKK